ncbi:acetoacetate decarboxylase family protein [Sporichthya brevicatena]|uniref:Acetoacetate decarboxylase family protein n=1 Tax=Sporichthya brevicatena TaxID=171442 RepID=A0ABN1H9N9_9ACTN
MAKQEAPGVWQLAEGRLTMPVRIRRASLLGAAYLCSAERAAELLVGTRLRPVSFRGRAVSTVLAVVYSDGDLGVYDEVGVGLLVRGPDRTLGMHQVHLPVNATFTMEAGRDIWGLPKWMADIDIAVERPLAKVRVADGGEHALTVSVPVPRFPAPVPFAVPIRTWGINPNDVNGELFRAPIRIRLRGLRVGSGRANVLTGTHSMGRAAAELGVGSRPLMVMYSPHVSIVLGESKSYA